MDFDRYWEVGERFVIHRIARDEQVLLNNRSA